MHKTTILCQFCLIICHQLPNHLSTNSHPFLVGVVSITRGLEVFVDTSFTGNWDKQDAQTGDRDTARSRHGYIILYYGCPLIWKSQLQTEIAISSTESEYTGLSYALRETIPLMALLEELREQHFPVDQTKVSLQCKVFEDNSGAIEIATNHKSKNQAP